MGGSNQVRTVAIIAFVVLMLPVRGSAQVMELTLNCKYERGRDVATNGEFVLPADFSATVRMLTDKADLHSALIEATTDWCSDYVGSFTDLEVAGDCERFAEAAKLKIKASLRFNRVSGGFEHDLLIGTTYAIFHGRCAVGKKLF